MENMNCSFSWGVFSIRLGVTVALLLKAIGLLCRNDSYRRIGIFSVSVSVGLK